MTEENTAPTNWREAFAQLKTQLQRMSEPRPLAFAPAKPGVTEVKYDTHMQSLLPTRGYADDAGLDLYISEDTVIGPHEFADVPSGVRVDIPNGHWLFIVGRSSTLRKRGLLVNPGIIDAGWTGELFSGVQNLTDEEVLLYAGDRVAQAILLPAPVTGYRPEWGDVREKERGTNGFGSTGA